MGTNDSTESTLKIRFFRNVIPQIDFSRANFIYLVGRVCKNRIFGFLRRANR